MQEFLFAPGISPCAVERIERGIMLLDCLTGVIGHALGAEGLAVLTEILHMLMHNLNVAAADIEFSGFVDNRLPGVNG